MEQMSPVGHTIYRLSIAWIVITAVFVGLRIQTRTQSLASFAADDWWVLLSLISYYVFLGLSIWCELYCSLRTAEF